ncbi:uncharacterized protein E6C27_scaffold316G001200 [Cucumis melo var. makuwa]|uniref:Uncharacterized protein n=1 Tax=Cucumis melo var. makuwa TaxID=1194695 RepID=A0A5A7TQF0_CUCMM|nr:uncharacterized protein E6C27_scaffold316G001200 [Cucumis melo var. makuwa]
MPEAEQSAGAERMEDEQSSSTAQQWRQSYYFSPSLFLMSLLLAWPLQLSKGEALSEVEIPQTFFKEISMDLRDQCKDKFFFQGRSDTLSQILIMVASRCFFCGKPLSPGGSRAWAVVLFITCWNVERKGSSPRNP